MLTGACHCGALTLQLTTARALTDLPVRTCGCAFCVRHRPRYTCDPAGQVTIRARTAASLVRYRFGLRLGDFLLCATCGVFVAAFDDAGLAVVNLEVLDRRAEFTQPAGQFLAYDSEDAAARTARRAKSWTPATLVVDV